VEAIVLRARARLSGSLRLQKLFCRRSGRRSSRGLLSNHCRGCYKNKIGTILRPSAESFAPDSIAVTIGRAPASDLPPEQWPARRSGKRQQQTRCFCVSFQYRSFQSFRFGRFANMDCPSIRMGSSSLGKNKAYDAKKPGIISRAFPKQGHFTEAGGPGLPHGPWDQPSSTITNRHLHSRTENDCQVGLFW
jgi:hypothetical protein